MSQMNQMSQARRLNEASAATTGQPSSLIAALLALAASRPQALALRSDRAAYTWRELAATTARRAASLPPAASDEAAALALAADAEALALTMLACRFAGRAFLPLRPDGAPPPFAAGLMQLNSPPPLAPAACPAATADPEAPALLIATSGSEGVAKGVLLPERALVAAAAASAERTPLAAGDVWLVCLPLYHIGGMAIFWRAFRAGAALRLHDGFDAARVWRELQGGGVSHLSLVPAMLAQLLDVAAGEPPPVSLRAVLIGGAALSEPLGQRASAAGWPLVVCYGMSETAAQAISLRAGADWKSGLVGTPHRGMEVKISRTGRICLRGPQLFLGYLEDGSAASQQPALTADGWLETGDLGFIDQAGRLHVSGRADDVLVSGGEKIHPQEIESALAACPGVRDLAITATPDPTWGDLVSALVVGVDAERLAAWSKRLPSRLRPRRIVEVAALPRTPLGKLERHRLPALLGNATLPAQPASGERQSTRHRLLVALAAQAATLQERLQYLAAEASADALLSVGIDLGASASDLLDLLPAGDFFYLGGRGAKTAQGEPASPHRLGIGSAFACHSAGAARFEALQRAHAGLAAGWHYETSETSETNDMLPGGAPKAFLGFSFAPGIETDAAAGFPAAALEVPAIELYSANGRLGATLTTPAAGWAEALAGWQRLLAEADRSAAPSLGASAVNEPPVEESSRTDWRERVRLALAAIAAGELEKLVLARQLSLHLATPPAAARLIAQLARSAAAAADAVPFAHRRSGQLFIGATPERLLRLQAGELAVDALAGTAWEEKPLFAAKNRREQALVVDAVLAALTPLCSRLQLAAQPQRQPAPGALSHLFTPFTGRVWPEVSIFELIARLHPTPAVGGAPQQAALTWLAAHGEDRPAWYTGGIGWVDARGDGEIVVPLRCGLLSGRQAAIFAGAGIVAGSEADEEFAETAAKFATMLDALAAARES